MTKMSKIAQEIWAKKYKHSTDNTVEDMWLRVAGACASVEKPGDREGLKQLFYTAMEDFKFIPAGRILSAAGTGRRNSTAGNCYVMGTIEDSMEGIFQTVKEAAITQRQGGGVGFDFSTIRPAGNRVDGCESDASGPVSFMQVFDASCRTIVSAGNRRGAMLGALRCDHPDIERFIEAKRGNAALKMFNLSVAVTDKFMAAVKADSDWDLVFDNKLHKTMKARDLWDKIMRATYDYAEPGVMFIDTVNNSNNLGYIEKIATANPCGEIYAPPYGVCLLGSINLTKFVSTPFTKTATVDLESIKNLTKVAVRMMDDVLDFCVYPLPQQADEARAKRRMGLGITGLADMLAMKGLKYDSPKARELAESVMEAIKNAAYAASCDLAAEKGPFPLFEYDKYSQGQFFKGLDPAVKNRVKEVGLRNSHLLAVAPTGTISLLAGNVSSGLEPVFALKYDRKIRTGKGDETTTEEVRDYAYAMLVDGGVDAAEAAKHFQTSDEVSIEGHLQMQACLQRHVDHSISKTCNIPADYPFEKFRDVYKRAHALGLKGCTTFRPSEHIQGVLTKTGDRPKEAAGPATKAGLVKLMWEFLAGKPVEREAPRPEVLPGVTYKLRVPGTDDAYYVTINDEVVVDKANPSGVIKPYEVFINTKNLTHFPWIVSMTRMLSAIFRKEDNPAFIADELLSVYDPVGGFFDKGRYVPSVAAAIGHCIKGHLASIGAAEPESAPKAPPPAPMPEDNKAFCPQCSAREAVMSEGCLKCLSCGYSKCG
jgi:ribonucleoside-diphosphate reductase alpha chain